VATLTNERVLRAPGLTIGIDELVAAFAGGRK
jgi:hypothetical protein